MKIEIGDAVSAPEPNESDIHNHSFLGTVKSFRNGNVVVEDSEGDCFEFEPDRLLVLDESEW